MVMGFSVCRFFAEGDYVFVFVLPVISSVVLISDCCVFKGD